VLSGARLHHAPAPANNLGNVSACTFGNTAATNPQAGWIETCAAWCAARLLAPSPCPRPPMPALRGISEEEIIPQPWNIRSCRMYTSNIRQISGQPLERLWPAAHFSVVCVCGSNTLPRFVSAPSPHPCRFPSVSRTH
jgi:hypothetical protein